MAGEFALLRHRCESAGHAHNTPIEVLACAAREVLATPNDRTTRGSAVGEGPR